MVECQGVKIRSYKELLRNEYADIERGVERVIDF